MEENLNTTENPQETPEPVENPAPETPAAEPTAEEALKKQLEDMTAQYQQMREIAARAQADGMNYRNWAEREMQRLKAQGGERAVLALVPVYDHLEMAVNAKTDDVESLKKGVRMVLQQFEEALKSQGVTVLDPQGQPFSPLEHDAMGMAPVADKAQDGLVQFVVRKGLKMAEKVIRPASVMVGRYTEPAAETQE